MVRRDFRGKARAYRVARRCPWSQVLPHAGAQHRVASASLRLSRWVAVSGQKSFPLIFIYMRNDLRLVLGFIGACSLICVGMLRLTFDLAFETRQAVVEMRETQRLTQEYAQILIQRQGATKGMLDSVWKLLVSHDESNNRQLLNQQMFLLDIRRDMQPVIPAKPAVQ